MSGDFKLRKGSIADFDALFDIYMHPKTNPFLTFEIMSKENFKPIFDDLMHSGQLYVFEHKNEIVATCIVSQFKRRMNHVVSLGTLAAHHSFQRKGMGSHFIRELIKKLKQEGIKRIELLVEADNPAAIEFYKKLGFEHEGTLRKFFKRPAEQHYIDDHVMAMVFD